jgi:ubiquinone/menaquinone biosynthesis C-methylase UbiE
VDAHALWAPSYDSNPNPILSLEDRTVEPLLPRMEGMRTLDVACGTGRWLKRFLQRQSRLAVGVDLCEEMLEQARTKHGVTGHLIEADALAIPLGESSIDFAICSFGLSHVTNACGLAGELARVLRDDGSLILTDFHPDAEARGWKRGFRHQADVVEIVSFPRPVEEIEDLFEREGFKRSAHFEPQFGEAERLVFEACGRVALFEALLGQTAIYVSAFRKEGRGALRQDDSSKNSARRRFRKHIRTITHPVEDRAAPRISMTAE